MTIIYIAGGNYKSFYLNCFLRLSKCDLLIFNFNIFYDYNFNKEKQGSGVVTNEILEISQKLNCAVLAGVYSIKNNHKTKSIIFCDGRSFVMKSSYKGLKFYVKNMAFVAGEKNANFENHNKIIITSCKLKPNLLRCNKRKVYLFCDDYGVSCVVNKNLKRKFNKCSKIILK